MAELRRGRGGRPTSHDPRVMIDAIRYVTKYRVAGAAGGAPTLGGGLCVRRAMERPGSTRPADRRAAGPVASGGGSPGPAHDGFNRLAVGPPGHRVRRRWAAARITSSLRVWWLALVVIGPSWLTLVTASRAGGGVTVTVGRRRVISTSDLRVLSNGTSYIVKLRRKAPNPASVQVGSHVRRAID